MRSCKQCGESLPNRVVIEGKVRNIKNRKYCLECSPFGQHNTKKLHRPNTETKSKTCKSCGQEFSTKKQAICASCQYNKQLAKRYGKIYDRVGTACWYCGYDKGMKGTSILDFHHVDPEKKCFNITRREAATMKWEKVFAEMKKCVLLCCRCHREYHAGFISESEMVLLHQRWLKFGDVA